MSKICHKKHCKLNDHVLRKIYTTMMKTLEPLYYIQLDFMSILSFNKKFRLIWHLLI